jgi:hypothetical protein
LTEYLVLADDLLIVETVLGVPAEVIARWPGFGLADSALHVPGAGFGTVGNSITIWECRPPGRPEEARRGVDADGIARFRYSPSERSWTVYWMRSDLEFHRYTLVGPESEIGTLLDEVARDPHACFWG